MLPQIIGRQQAFALLGLGQGFSADRAKTAGLIYDVVDEDDLERDVFAAAEEIAAKPPRGAEDRARPDARLRVTNSSPASTRRRELFGERLRSDEARAAFTAFMNRKKGSSSPPVLQPLIFICSAMSPIRPLNGEPAQIAERAGPCADLAAPLVLPAPAFLSRHLSTASRLSPIASRRRSVSPLIARSAKAIEQLAQHITLRIVGDQ